MNTKIEMKFAFLGSGIIAEVWIDRLLSSGCLAPDQVMVCDVRTERVTDLVQRFGVTPGKSNIEGAAFGDAIVLAVPPSECEKVLMEIASVLGRGKTVVSLA